MTGVRVFQDEARADAARRMIANGMTDRVVAEAFGVERSTVAWFRRRHRIPSARTTGKKDHHRVPLPVTHVLPSDSRPLKGEAWDALPGISPVALVDLDAGMCRWPIGVDRPYLFCGASSTGSYCRTHTAMAEGRGTESERAAHRARVK